jgi:hypothetical protein
MSGANLTCANAQWRVLGIHNLVVVLEPVRGHIEANVVAE